MNLAELITRVREVGIRPGGLKEKFFLLIGIRASRPRM